MLFADLERRRPALLVDAAAAGWNGYDKFPLARYPRLRAALGCVPGVRAVKYYRV